jgi:hypothetical protein
VKIFVFATISSNNFKNIGNVHANFCK